MASCLLPPAATGVVYMVMASHQKQGTRNDGADEMETEAENAFLNVISGESHTESGDFDEFDCIVEALPDKEESHQNNTKIITGHSSVSNVRVDTDARTVGEPSNLTAELVNSESVNQLRNSSQASSSEHASRGIAELEQEARRRGGRARLRSPPRSNIPPGIRKLPSPPTTLEQAQMEWDLVATVQPGNGVVGSCSPTVSFQTAIRHFQTAHYLEQHMSLIKPTNRRQGVSAFTHILFGPPKMYKHLHNERNLIFALALCMFRNEEPMHSNILMTIYKKLTGTSLDCPRYGNHWELIGFQGLDPATDLRGCGFLGLMTLLHFVTDTRTHHLAKDIFKLSQHETQNFPFCIMSINITRIALQTLREELLNRDCNQRQQVINTFNDFYVALFHQVYHIWKYQHKTIQDSGFVLKEVEKCAKKNARTLLRNLDQILTERRALIIPEEANPSPKSKHTDQVQKFAGVCDLQVDEEEEVHLV